MIISVSIISPSHGAAVPESLSNLFMCLCCFLLILAGRLRRQAGGYRSTSGERAAAAIAGDIKWVAPLKALTASKVAVDGRMAAFARCQLVRVHSPGHHSSNPQRHSKTSVLKISGTAFFFGCARTSPTRERSWHACLPLIFLALQGLPRMRSSSMRPWCRTR